MKAVNIKARAGGEWRYRVLERVPGWGWSHWAEPELKAGCATGGLEIYEAWLPVQFHRKPLQGKQRESRHCVANYSPLPRDPGSDRELEMEGESTADGRKPGEWRERKVLCAASGRPHRKHIPAWIIRASHQLPYVTFDLACVHECFANNMSLST